MKFSSGCGFGSGPEHSQSGGLALGSSGNPSLIQTGQEPFRKHQLFTRRTPVDFPGAPMANNDGNDRVRIVDSANRVLVLAGYKQRGK